VYVWQRLRVYISVFAMLTRISVQCQRTTKITFDIKLITMLIYGVVWVNNFISDRRIVSRTLVNIVFNPCIRHKGEKTPNKGYTIPRYSNPLVRSILFPDKIKTRERKKERTKERNQKYLSHVATADGKHLTAITIVLARNPPTSRGS